MPPRDVPTTLRTTEKLDDFIASVAKKSHHTKSTMYYIAVLEWAEALGFEDSDVNLNEKKNK
jgi:hypothetical protein